MIVDLIEVHYKSNKISLQPSRHRMYLVTSDDGDRGWKEGGIDMPSYILIVEIGFHTGWILGRALVGVFEQGGGNRSAKRATLGKPKRQQETHHLQLMEHA